MTEDTVDRFERLANLVTFLLETDRGVTYAEILEAIPGYPEGAEARRRAFERDKKLLRDEDIPIELDEETERYRIRPEEYYLPDLGLSDEEQLALQLAVAAVPVAADEGGAALQKLTIGGGDARAPARVSAALAELDAHPLLPVLHQAIRQRATVTFRRGPEERTVEPSLLFFREGNWYLHGFDRLRDEPRTFRVDRIESDVQVGAPNSFARRTDPPADPAAAMPHQPWLMGDDGPEAATVRVDEVLAAKAAADAGSSASVTRHEDGSVTLTVPVAQRDFFRSWVLGMLDHAEVVEPPELRADMEAWLRAIADAGA